MHWHECHQRDGTRIWLNLAAVRSMEVMAQPETFTRLWLDKDHKVDVRETPQERVVAAAGGAT